MYSRYRSFKPVLLVAHITLLIGFVFPLLWSCAPITSSERTARQDLLEKHRASYDRWKEVTRNETQNGSAGDESEKHTNTEGSPDLSSASGTLELTLSDAVQLALGENQRILISSLNPRIARAEAREALGTFDPELYGRLEREDARQPTGTQLSGAATLESEERTRRAGVRGATVLGMEYDLFYELIRDESNSTFRTLNPQFQGAFGIALSQPLLRGFGPEVQLAQYRARLHRLTKQQYEELSTINDQIFAVHRAYWQLARTEEERKIAENALELAEETVEVNRARYQADRIPQSALLQARTQLTERQEQLRIRENEVRDARDRLIQLISPPGTTSADWDVKIRTATEPDTTAPALKDQQKLVELATKTRMDLQALDMEIDAVDQLVKRAESLTKPELDLEVSYRRTSLDEQRNDTFEQIVEDDFRTWTAGLIFSYPLWNRSRSSRERKRKLDRRKLQLRRRKLETTIARQVRSGIRNVESAKNRIEIARKSKNLAEKQLEAETARQEAGLSTTFQVLRLQDDLRRAKARLVKARMDYATSLAELRNATGMMVSKYMR